MESFTRFIGWFLINVDAFLLIIIALGVVLLCSRTKSRGKKLMALGLAGLFFVAIVPVGVWLMVGLENRFPKPEALPEHTVGVILLGGSFDLASTNERGFPVYNLLGGRLLDFIAFTKKHPHLKRVFTGGGKIRPVIDGQKMGEADITQKVFKEMGYDTHGMIFEGNSNSTLENAWRTYEAVQPKPGEKWVLMTSAYHLPRAVGLFRKAGWDVVPYPVDYHTPGNYGMLFFLGLKEGLVAWHYAVREWATLLQNCLYGHSDEIFPGPASR